MISFSSKYRSQQEEIMDDFNLQGLEMKALLTDLDRVNKMLGGTKVTISGIKRLLEGRSKNNTYTLVDIGCGDGALLRSCADWAEQYGFNLQLIGIDANAHILEEAEKRSTSYKSISYQKIDVFSREGNLPKFDVALCTLFLHHFSNEDIMKLLVKLTEQAKVGLVINDLHRSRWAFMLFKIFSKLLLRTRIARHDGLVSVARGFKKKELKTISAGLDAMHQIQWKWAFRYQWTIKV